MKKSGALKGRTLSNTKTMKVADILKIFFLLLIIQFGTAPIAKCDGIEWSRLRLRPSLGIRELYSDNIYLENEDAEKKDQFITEVKPEIAVDLAVVPRNYFTIMYQGIFNAYSDLDNFREDHHFGGLSFNGETKKGSHLIIGVSLEDTAVQPDSISDQPEDYTINEAYADILMVPGSMVEIGAEVLRSERDFDKRENIDDNYTRDRLDLSLLYKRSQVIPLLLQYRYVNQDNNDQETLNTDYNANTFLIGARWRPESKLSGALRVGHTRVEFKESGVEDFNAFAADTNLVYHYSPITRFRLIAQHGIETPTRSLREPGDFYEYTNIGLVITHRKWERITTTMDLEYRLRDFKEITSQSTIREDKNYRGGLSVAYAFRKWLSFELGYIYRKNESDDNDEEYTENQINMGITIKL